MGKAREKRLKNIKKAKNIFKNNISKKPKFKWIPAPTIQKTSPEAIQPKEVDSDWEYENYKANKEFEESLNKYGE